MQHSQFFNYYCYRAKRNAFLQLHQCQKHSTNLIVPLNNFEQRMNSLILAWFFVELPNRSYSIFIIIVVIRFVVRAPFWVLSFKLVRIIWLSISAKILINFNQKWYYDSWRRYHWLDRINAPELIQNSEKIAYFSA